ncbi:alpha/beta hydrolase family esterase [Actinokineospora soli]|uniref:Alpha/beta hydrolase family esterase n=1 Tax=Actinokineospora soli TaxID=1048753 RepID=A0ABW2TPF9_9PSEU
MRGGAVRVRRGGRVLADRRHGHPDSVPRVVPVVQPARPAGLSGSAPLLLSLHGLGSSPFGQEVASGWSGYADRTGFVVAYPAGEGGRWDFAAGSTDVRFLRRVVDHIAASTCVDPRRVYVDGGSLGSFMAQRAACDAPGSFAAVTGFMGGDPSVFGACAPIRPIAVALFHGEADPLVSVDAGELARDAWVKRNACDPTGIAEPVTDGTALRYTRCAGGVSVAWRSYAGLGHAYPSGAQADDWRDRAWRHLTAHTLP